MNLDSLGRELTAEDETKDSTAPDHPHFLLNHLLPQVSQSLNQIHPASFLKPFPLLYLHPRPLFGNFHSPLRRRQ